MVMFSSGFERILFGIVEFFFCLGFYFDNLIVYFIVLDVLLNLNNNTRRFISVFVLVCKQLSLLFYNIECAFWDYEFSGC
jgi:hypothetical protein